MGLAPAPDGGDLVLELECRLDPRAQRGERHEVVIHRDWSLTVPHDLRAERVAMAFGGYTSCVPLADQGVAALRHALPSIARRREAAPRRFGVRHWRLPTSVQVPDCCQGVSFRTLAEASAHSHQVSHLARLFSAPGWLVRELVSVTEAHWRAANRARATARGVERFVADAASIDALWDHGIDADTIALLAAALPPLDAPVPRAYFVGAHYGPADLEWVGTVVRGRPDPEVAAWAVSLPAVCSRTDARLWRDWLALGLPRSEVRFAVDHAGDPAITDQIAHATGWPAPLAARRWLAWVRVGCRPTAAQFAVIASRGVADAVPPAAAIDRLVSAVVGAPQAPEPEQTAVRSELGVMLALLGTVAEVLFEHRRGTTTVDALHRRGGRFLSPQPSLKPFTDTETSP